MKNKKVVLIGTGFVGMSYAYACLNQGTVDTLVLIDANKEKAIGEAMDLNHGLAFASKKIDIYAGDYTECKDAEIVVITAGAAQKEGETRLDLLKKNANIMKSITKEVVNSGFKGIFLIATNPVDILTQVVYEESGFDPRRVIGTGTTLDTGRLRYELSKYLKVDSRNVHAYILGEHGDSEFVCWSKVTVGVKPIIEVIKERRLDFEDLDKIYVDVRDAAYNIIEKKHATYYGIGMSLVRITNAILNDEWSILPVSSYVNGEYDGIEDVYVGLPSVINKNGISHVMHLELSIDEKQKLAKSVKILKEGLNSLKETN
ncbi:L-lactate dehydrogenase [Mycoplasmatota bacterium WC44]